MKIREIETARLDNGLRVVTEAMPHVRSVSVGVWIASGSRRETPPENGISHFIEHMLFKGTTTRSAEQIARSVDSIGGNLDAFTAKELVCYNTKVLDEHRIGAGTGHRSNGLFGQREFVREDQRIERHVALCASSMKQLHDR